jgi:hypothetical protein
VLPRTASAVIVHAILFYFDVAVKLHRIQNRGMLNAIQGSVITFILVECRTICVVCFDFKIRCVTNVRPNYKRVEFSWILFECGRFQSSLLSMFESSQLSGRLN